ncbi:MAG: hypothetical protein ACRDTT_01385 [Pseudonocardiaceae bacterium]
MLPFREEDADDVEYGRLLCTARRHDSKPRLALVGWHDAGRGAEMYPVIASSQLALKDK